MMQYLLILLSTLLLLFALPENGSRSIARESAGTSMLQRSCKINKEGSKRTCTKKCLKQHGKEASQQGTTTLVECSLPGFALLSGNGLPAFNPLWIRKVAIMTLAEKADSAALEIEPDPPQFS